MEKSSDEWLQRTDILNEVHEHSFNPDKVGAYLMGKGFYLAYRPIELICFA